jgi:hypothetical protein
MESDGPARWIVVVGKQRWALAPVWSAGMVTADYRHLDLCEVPALGGPVLAELAGGRRRCRRPFGTACRCLSLRSWAADQDRESSEHVHPDEFGVEQRIGGYDPDELLLVPMWAVVTARALIGRFTEHCRAGTAINFADETECGVWALAATAAEPLPGIPVPDTRHELAELLARVYDALRAALPGP